MKLFTVVALLLSTEYANAYVSPKAFSARYKSHSALNLVTNDDKLDCVMEEKNQKSKNKNVWNNLAASVALAGTIFASTAVASLPANANVELSSGALTIQTSKQNGQSLLRTEVDAKKLVSLLFNNRKDLNASVKRIASVVKEEFSQPAWLDVSREILQIEGDVAPEFKVRLPSDWQQTLKDISKGKLNIVYNGEIINLSVDDKFSAAEDEIVIRAKGVKGIPIPSLQETPTMRAKSNVEQQIDAVQNFWESPLPFGQQFFQKLKDDYNIKITTGNFILGGTVVFVGGSYAASYSYYISQIENSKKDAAAKRKMIEDKKRAAAATKAENENN
mmetsp:Transcript_29989/g.28884  ORF Transcript_29989/g.28884 Transcript_29989/m.28884 type:complete len:332 (-) Transcript_29989:240-1235(-)